jgi:hypothetical protein
MDSGVRVFVSSFFLLCNVSRVHNCVFLKAVAFEIVQNYGLWFQ